MAQMKLTQLGRPALSKWIYAAPSFSSLPTLHPAALGGCSCHPPTGASGWTSSVSAGSLPGVVPAEEGHLGKSRR